MGIDAFVGWSGGGHGWHGFATSNAGTRDLTGVVCIEPVRCYAVGGTVVRSWNGTTWTNVPDAV